MGLIKTGIQAAAAYGIVKAGAKEYNKHEEAKYARQQQQQGYAQHPPQGHRDGSAAAYYGQSPPPPPQSGRAASPQPRVMYGHPSSRGSSPQPGGYDSSRGVYEGQYQGEQRLLEPQYAPRERSASLQGKGGFENPEAFGDVKAALQAPPQYEQNGWSGRA